jgi:SAM-dependent methyltransferase
MNLSRLRETWTKLGGEDPLWAVLSNPGKRQGEWDLDEFFASGRKDIAEVMAKLTSLGVTVARDQALDFGCGVGRLTQALAREFSESTGVDIASTMIARARELAGPSLRCRFVENTSADLKQFDDATFDFVFSHIVFQHMEARFALAYIREFGRLLRPDGVAVFQALVPDGTHRTVNWMKLHFPEALASVRRITRRGEPAIELYGIPEDELTATLQAAHLDVIASVDDPNGGRGTRGVVVYTRKRPA